MTQERRLRVRTFTLGDRKEIISKIVREVLVLFKVEIVGRSGEADYLQLSVVIDIHCHLTTIRVTGKVTHSI